MVVVAVVVGTGGLYEDKPESLDSSALSPLAANRPRTIPRAMNKPMNDLKKPKNLVCLISGRGSNLEA
ncbi:MAG TPA: hypothetical protein VF229_01945, partial [Burkholderiaceae bacterium]